MASVFVFHSRDATPRLAILRRSRSVYRGEEGLYEWQFGRDAGVHKKKHRCVGGRNPCHLSLPEQREYPATRFGSARGETKAARGPRGILPRLRAILHFEPHLVFRGRPLELRERCENAAAAVRRSDALSRRCRSRHLLLALFFPATRHLHNYNLASAVSKTPAPDEGPSYQAPSTSVSRPVVVGRGEKRPDQEAAGGGGGGGKNELLPLTSPATVVSYRGKNNLGAGEGRVTARLSHFYGNTKPNAISIRSLGSARVLSPFSPDDPFSARLPLALARIRILRTFSKRFPPPGDSSFLYPRDCLLANHPVTGPSRSVRSAIGKVTVRENRARGGVEKSVLCAANGEEKGEKKRKKSRPIERG